MVLRENVPILVTHSAIQCFPEVSAASVHILLRPNIGISEILLAWASIIPSGLIPNLFLCL